MKKYIVDNVEYSITNEALLKKLHLPDDPDDEDYQKATSMLKEAAACSRPKFVYGIAPIEEKGDDYIVAAGHRLVSPLIRKNLDKTHRIIPYVATCGVEVDQWSRQFTDMLENFWADEIKNMILAQVIKTMRKTVREKFFGTSDMSIMSPGSLAAWPVTEQTSLFELIGNVQEDTGVVLTDSYLMLPSKSVSGFYFSSETHYENCRLCPMPDCPNRSAKYEETEH